MRQKGRVAGSKTVSAQWITLRPSHTGGWGLTPARRWHKHWQTKGLGSEQVVDLRASKSTKTDWPWRGFVMTETQIEGFEEIKLWTFHWPAWSLLCWEDCNSSTDWTISPVYEKIHFRNRAGVSAKWIQKQRPPFLPSDKKDLTLLRHHWGGNKRDLQRDARRWHHVKSIRDKVDISNYSGTEKPHPVNRCKLWSLGICVKYAKKQQHNGSAGTTRLFNSISTCAQLKVCQDYLWPE